MLAIRGMKILPLSRSVSNCYRLRISPRIAYRQFSFTRINRYPDDVDIDKKLAEEKNQDVDFNEIKSDSNQNESDVSAETTGVINTKSQEILLFYNHIYPVPISKSAIKQRLRWLLAPVQQTQSVEQLKEKVKKISSPIPDSCIEEFIPLKRDSGAFVKFTVPYDQTPEEFVGTIQKNVQATVDAKNKHWFYYILSFLGNYNPSVYPVKGTPWIEDLKRFPSTTLKVMFEGNPLTEEELYLLFRRYGVIEDIVPGTEFAKVVFKQARSAVSAKNCITGISLNKGKTILHIQYIAVRRINYIAELINSHQKIAMPIIIALIAATAVLIFDPIREWFIEQKITQKYSIDSYKKNSFFQMLILPFETVSRWLWRSYDYVDEFVRHENSVIEDDDVPQVFDADMVWSDRYEKGKQLKLWIYENVGTFIVVRGPKGSGKNDFVMENTLKPDEKLQSKILHIDCEEINKARSTNSLLKKTANEIGYFPLFTWTNSITQFVDLAVQGISGQKSGLSETKETQFKNMLQLATQAIRNITLNEYEDYSQFMTRKMYKAAEDEKVEILKYDAFLQQHPETKPIIVIDKFARTRKGDDNEFVNPTIAEWASNLIQNNLAHVIYITSDVGSVSLLNEALPNQVFKHISLSDASPSTAKQYLQSQLKLENTNYLADCLEPLGGRMTDLQAFIRRVKSGEEPHEALEELVNQAAEQITTFFLNSVNDDWNSAQVWYIMKLLSKCETIDFQELLKTSLFSRDHKTLSTLETLEKHDLVQLHRNKGALDQISMGRPLFHSAFQTLINDKRIFKIYEIDYLSKLISIENEKIRKLEDEIKNIYPVRLNNRVQYLSQKIETSNGKIVKYEGESQLVLNA